MHNNIDERQTQKWPFFYIRVAKTRESGRPGEDFLCFSVILWLAVIGIQEESMFNVNSLMHNTLKYLFKT